MSYIKTYIGDLFFGRNFYYGITLCSGMFVMAFFIPFFEPVAYLLFLLFLVLVLTDYTILFLTNRHFHARRILPNRFSNGEENTVSWVIKNEFSFPARIELVEEWPEQLEIRNQQWQVFLKGKQQKQLNWKLRPVKRGEYSFGYIRLFVKTPLGLISRRFTSGEPTSIACYPSFIRLNHYGIRSNAIVAHQAGSVRMRSVGQSMEFEQIKEYITGDDIRTLNWKASARRGALMVNQYAHERAQQIYCMIDKGRLMKMPFNEMTLLDYAINASLILSSVCLDNKDKVGLVTFSNEIDSMLAADNRPSQMGRIMETLYRQETDFLESDFELLYHTVRTKIKNRSLLILFTNFESVAGLHRQKDYIRSLAKYHLVLIVFFENTELKTLIKQPAHTVQDVYVKTVAGKFALEKKLIVSELSNYGIATLLVKPNELTVKTVNKYLELKMKSAI